MDGGTVGRREGEEGGKEEEGGRGMSRRTCACGNDSYFLLILGKRHHCVARAPLLERARELLVLREHTKTIVNLEAENLGHACDAEGLMGILRSLTQQMAGMNAMNSDAGALRGKDVHGRE